MPAYQYRAIDSRGRIHNGAVNAQGAPDLEARLAQMGLELLNYRQRKFKTLAFLGQRISRRDLIVLFYHLEQTCRAGVPIMDSLADFRDSTENAHLKITTAALITAIEGGRTLSGAMQDHPVVFNNIICSLISAGEMSGRIAEIFGSISENLKWQDEQAALTKKLMSYPAFVCTVITGVIFFLMIYLVPGMLQFVRAMGQEIPMHTRALLFMSGLLTEFWYVFLFGPAALAVMMHCLIRTIPPARYYVDAIVLKLPLLGTICKKIILARMARFIAIMYASGITIIECVSASEKIAGNRVYAEAMHRAGELLLAGGSLGSSLERARVLPPMALRMVRIGENTGTLEQSLLAICYFYTRDARESIERLQAMIEPAMTLFLGSVIGWIMFSILGPIYDLIAHVKV